jgi:isobutyryl-CoA dehydrogenase
LRNLIGV